MGHDRREEADGRREGCGESRARPGDALRARVLPCAHVGADHGHQRRAHSEHQRNLEVLESRAHAIARESGGAEGADEPRHQHHGQVGEDGVQRAGRAHAQDLPEELAAKTQAPEGQLHRAPGRAEIDGEHEGGCAERGHVRRRRAGHAQPREGPPAQHEGGSQREVNDGGAAGDRRGKGHGSGAADDARQRIEEPVDDGSAEDHVRVRHGCLERLRGSPHGAIDGGPAQQEARGEHGGHDEGDQDGVSGEGLGLGPASRAEGPRHRGGHAASHAAGRHGLHEHDERVDEGDSGEGGGPEPSDEDRVQRAQNGLEHHHEDVGRGQTEQGGGNGRLEQLPGAGRYWK